MQESTLISNSELRYSKHPALTDIVKERDLPVTLIDIMESEPKEDAANQVHPRSYRAELRFILIVEPIPALYSDRWVAQHFPSIWARCHLAQPPQPRGSNLRSILPSSFFKCAAIFRSLARYLCLSSALTDLYPTTQANSP